MIRVRPIFFDQVGHENMNASSGNKHFFTNHAIVRLTKIMNNLLEHLKIRTFSHFSVLKNGRIFPKKICMKNIGLEDQLLLRIVFENFSF